jgi:predicted O-methyltransferase YrrM
VIQLISKVWRFAKFYSKSTSVRKVHSPFVYEFLENIVLNNTPYYIFKPLESLRASLSLNNSVLSIDDFGAGSSYSGGNKRSISSILHQSVKPQKYAELIFRIVHKWKPQTMLELGTSLGLTSIYLSKANTDGKLITVEGSSEIAEVAGNGFKKFDCKNIVQIVGKFDEELPKILMEYKVIDFAFIDGNHQEAATIRYFDQLLQHITPDSILIFDDIHWSSGMERAWETIIQHNSVTLSLDLFEMGIVFFFKRHQKEHHLIRF